MFERLRQDVRHALRALRHSPGFAAVAVLTLGLGIGANTAIFSVINAVMVRPLPYEAPSRLVTVEHFYPSLNGGMEAPVSVPGFHDYQAQTRLFERAAVENGWAPTLTVAGEDAERLRAAQASGDYFATYGVAPMLGRVFRADEAQAGRDRVAVLSHAFWSSRFGADSTLVGRAIQLNGEAYEVIGVMPPGFRDFWGRSTAVWVPLVFEPGQLARNNATNEFLQFTGRLADGVTVGRARDEMRALATRLKADYPDEYAPDWTLRVTPLSLEGQEALRTALFVLQAAVGFVLLIACANVANLQLARMSARSREVAVRVALGASPRRLVRQLMTESVVLALLGGALGLLLAVWAVPALLALNPGDLPPGSAVRLDPLVLAFTLGVSVLTGLVFGVMPAAQVVRTDVHDDLKDGGRGAGGDRGRLALRRGLVISTVALALTLLTGAGLLMRSFSRLVVVDPGFRPANLLTFNLVLPAARYANDTLRTLAAERLTQAIAAVPGVRSVGATSNMPFGGGWSTGSFNVEGHTPPPNGLGPWGDQRIVTPGFLPTLGVELKAGRFFTEADGPDAPRVAVVDEGMVARFWPGQDPIGKRVTFNSLTDTNITWITVVGVVAHTLHEGLDGQHRVQMYRPLRQRPLGFLWVAVRTDRDPRAVLGGVREAVRGVDRDLAIAGIATMDELIEGSTGPRRFTMLLLGVFAALAAGLACIGLYGVMSYTVAQRARELGVRVALGAEARDVLRLVVGQGMRLTLAGVAIGAVAALAATRLMRSMLFDVSARDPLTFAATATLLVAVALLATWLPARRAAAVDPMSALRSE